MITLRGVSHRWGQRTVLDDISCDLSEPRIGIIGDNGSGKSSLVRLINGLLMPDRGTVRVNDLDVRKQPAAVRRQVGFVFQNPDVQIIHPTVEEDVRFGLQNLKIVEPEQSERLHEVLSRFGLTDLREASSHTLSGGQKQLLALASVLVMEPSILVLDEPTTLLDRFHTQRLRTLIAGLDQQVILVTHDFEDLRGFDRVLVIDTGRVVADAAPEEAIGHYCARVQSRLDAPAAPARDSAGHPAPS